MRALALLLLALPAAAAPELRAMARRQDPADLPPLKAALEGEDAAERTEAAFALGQLGMLEVPAGSSEPARAALARAAAAELLAPAASDPDPVLRRAAVEALGKLGGRDTDVFLLAAATDVDAGVRAEAATALFRRRFLGRVPDYSAAAVSRLLLLAADADPEVRWRAAHAFSRWAEPRAATTLAVLQGDPDARVRLFAVRSLAQLPAAPEAARLSDPDLYVRAEAVAALAAAKEWGSLPDAVFSDPSAHVRAAAADAAGASGDAARFAPLVERLAGEPGTLARGRALVALARLHGPGAAGVLEKARADASWWIRARAYEAAGLPPAAEDVLVRGTADPDPRAAAQALETLAASTSPAALAVLDRVLRDPKAELELLGTAVEAAASRAPELVDALLAALSRAGGVTAELRGGLRGALSAAKAGAPARAAEIDAALARFPPFSDAPRRFKPVRNPPSVLFETERGSFTVVLAGRDDAGVHAAAFLEGVRKGFYDGLTWHRVVTSWVVQGGDPRGSGWGDAGWRLEDELNRIPFVRGVVGMPKAGPDTGGCQLFVMLVPAPRLDGRYTAFGRVTDGMDVLDRVEPGDRILRVRAR